MVNLWGPGAFDSLNPSATRPVSAPDNAPGDVDDWFKDCSSPLLADGTEWRSALLNLLIANLRSVVTGSGTAKSNLDNALLAKAIQSGGMNWAAATGTANNWTIALNLALASYRAGLPLMLKPPATNTSATVVAAIDGLAARPVKKADGSNPAVGDLVVGRWYPTIDDGTNICVLATLPSDIIVALNAAPSPPQLNFFELAILATQNVGSGVTTTVTDHAIVGAKASDAVFSAGGTITIGPKTAGIWSFSQAYLPSQTGGAPSITQAYLLKNGLAVQNQTVSGTFCTNSGVVRVAAGDTLQMAVWQNSGNVQKNQHAPALPQKTSFNLYHISS